MKTARVKSPDTASKSRSYSRPDMVVPIVVIKVGFCFVSAGIVSDACGGYLRQ